MLLAEGDGLVLPIGDKSQCFVLRGNASEEIHDRDEAVLEDMTQDKEHVQFGDRVMTLTNLEAGFYNVAVGQTRDQEIQVQVIKGERFEIQGRRFIQSKNKIVQLPKEDNFWRLQTDDEKGDITDQCGSAHIGIGELHFDGIV